MAEHIAYILLGTNLGNRFSNLEKARKALTLHAGNFNTLSSVYETAAWGVEDQPPYLNQVAELQTQLSAAALLEVLQSTEQALGRTRHLRWEARVIDLDLLFFDQQVMATDLLTVPHPRLHQRRFTLIPLAEIAPEFWHPVLKARVSQLLASCTDELPVKKVEGEN